MTHFKTLRTTVCLAALVSASSATADVTAEQVWENWKENLAIYGEDGVSIGSEDIGDGTVTVSDLMLKMEDEFSSVEANLGTITFTEQGDGSVAVTMSDSYPITIVPEDGGLIRLNVSQSGMEMIVSGDEADMTYDVSADRYAFEVVEMVEDGEALIDGEIMFAANDLNGTYNVKTGELRNLDYDLSMGSLDLLMDFTEPGGDGVVVVSGKLDAVTLESEMAIPLEIDPENPEQMFADGFSFTGGYGFSAANYIFDFNVDGDSAVGSVAIGEGAVNAAMDADSLAYDVGVQNVALNIQSSEFPFPIEIGLAEYGIGLAMPLSSTEEPADFGLNINFSELTINDQIWALADPGEVLPRDPATVRIDLTGQAKLFFDLMDPEQAEAMEQAEVPGELNALTLNDLLVSAGGAMITGTGDFTFDNTDLETFDGMPRPLGEASIQITGANALIDKLVSMGLLPQDQASMGRMFMGMFARSTGDDQLETTVEVNEEGHLIVNGQRMQ
ncbi:hypothetical protein SAMN04488515_3268 [Cognatiyoonia koreensis]|uniref:DUF2125 domain-containing protein n=1 Tax=Cognatiyoonia koreensis TaxID=364200 RepID=A0A1I0RU75_9RHOB|nr:DUF2125 domain-containing protein [Cognatiyoonia koreensis]SEW44973.1 hypothetical protein SAMN04488515_3268 [Cognatiyoonia koreensis]